MTITLWGQTVVLLRKNFIMRKRMKLQAIAEMIWPVYFVAILVAITFAINPGTYSAIPQFPTYPLTVQSVVPTEQVLAYAPNTTGTGDVMRRAASVMGLNSTLLVPLASEADVRSFYSNNPMALWAGVVFDLSAANYSSWHLLVNQSSIPSLDNMYNDPTSCRAHSGPVPLPFGGGDNCPSGQYFTSGVSTLLWAVNTAVVETITGSGAINFTLGVQQMPKEEAKMSMSSTSMGSIAPSYYIFAFTGSIQYMVTNIVSEKEKKLREAMRVMGLRNAAFWLSWTLTYALTYLLTCGVITGLSYFVFTASNLFLLFLQFYGYALSILAFAFLVTPFFQRARSAAMFASLGMSLFGALTIPVNMHMNTIPAVAKYFISLLSPCCLALGIGVTFVKDGEGGLGFNNVAEGGYSVAGSLGMLYFDTFLYLLLAYYFDQVIPSEFGVRRHPFFFLGFKNERNNSVPDGVELRRVPEEHVEDVPADVSSRPCIDIENMTKVWPKSSDNPRVLALQGVSLKIFQGEIFALLGHNGAGKSTLANILCGMYAPSSGGAEVFGLDIAEKMTEVRHGLGYCPQHDILFPSLTPREHLETYAGIKGVQNWKQRADEVLKAIDLEEQADVDANVMSGGQKRKLCVGIALVGDPMLMVLDEPTSGMDPLSRRKLWDTLQAERRNRAILLTTHFMDEADILADRKAILSHGRVYCVGSSLFLKHRFGIGYALQITVPANTTEARLNGLGEVVKSCVSEAELERDGVSGGCVVEYKLPLGSTRQFADLFAKLDAEGPALGMEGYGLALPTLEQVFVEVDERVHEEAGTRRPRGALMRPSAGSPLAPQREDDYQEPPPPAFKTQVLAMCKAKFWQDKRRRQTWRFQVIMPVILCVIGMILARTSTPTHPTSLSLTTSLYGTDTFPYATPDGATAAFGSYFLPVINRSADIVQVIGNISAAFNPYILAHQPETAGLLVNDYSDVKNSNLTMMFNDTRVHSLPNWINLIFGAQLAALQSTVPTSGNNALNVVLEALPSGVPQVDTSAWGTIMLIGLSLVVQAGTFALPVVKERESMVRHGLFVSGLPVLGYWLSHFLMALAVYMIVGILLIILTLIFQVHAFMGAGFVPFMLLILLYLPTMILFAFAVSFLFKKTEVVQGFLPSIMSILTIVGFLPIVFLSEKPYAKWIHLGMCFGNPPYTIMGGFFYIWLLSIQGDFGVAVTQADYFKWSNNILPCYLSMIFYSSILLFVLVYLEFWRLRRPDHPPPVEDDGSARLEDNDVQSERQRLTGAGQQRPGEGSGLLTSIAINGVKTLTDPCAMLGFRKVFGRTLPVHENGKVVKKVIPKVAVHDLSLGVAPGTVLGLLGPNGAGKTTALGMLTGSIVPTAGDALIDGHSIRKDMQRAFAHMGYCPQFDALWEDLTGREHLKIHAAIRGLSESQAQSRIESLIRTLSIDEHADKITKTYSGGTKRKLSFAISMLGMPRVVLLDEPSTGMDPATRRFMWEIIHSTAQGRAVILTTHSMEEAEELCSRIAIMVNGRLRCVGPSAHLKNKYALHYLLEMKLPVERQEEGKRFVLGMFPGATELENYGTRVQWRVPITTPNGRRVALADVFRKIEGQRDALELEEYSFSQATLEQVFLDFAKAQEEE